MNAVVAVARILLGLAFTVFGLNGFLHFIPGAPPPGPAAQFTDLIAITHYGYFLFATQVICGLMLLTNQFVPLALVTLAAVLANIIAFHLTMFPMGMPPALIVTVLWFVVALKYRAHFAPLFARKLDSRDRRPYRGRV